MSIKLTYYVHGTTYDNSNKKCSGWKQVELNDLGKIQAKELGKNTPYKFDVLFTSDLIRAIETAKLAFPGMNFRTDVRLRECNYGIYDGEDKSLVKYNEHIEIPFENGESFSDVESRIRDFIDYLKQNYDEKTIGIIAHRVPQLALDVITKNISWEDAINNDWRKSGDWKPGWIYEIN